MSDKRFTQLTILITIAGIILRLFQLSSQPAAFDDFGVGITAINYLENGQPGPTMWNHPGLRNIIVYWSMSLLGSGVWGVKGWSLLFGVLTVPLVALIGRRILRNGAIALTAAFLWMLDPLAIDYSRQSINDIYLAFFPLTAIWCAYRFIDRRTPWWLVVSGILFGFGLASKWSVLFQIVPTAILLLTHMVRYGRTEWRAMTGPVLLLVSTLVILPITVYLLTFAPWFGRGYSIAEWPALQQAMYRETKLHTGYKKTIVGDHKAYEWFIRPVTYHDLYYNSGRDDTASHEPTMDKSMTLLLVVTNPLVWLLVLPAVTRTAWRGIRERSEGLCFLAALFCFSYIPLVLADRPIWLNTALSVLPFALMAVAWFLWDVLGTAAARGRIIAVYLAVAALTAVPQYLLVIGTGFKVPAVQEYLLGNYSRSGKWFR